jgi:hypothetical protein
MTTPAETVTLLFGRLSDLDRLLKNDAVWAPLAGELLAGNTPEFERGFWLALEEEIKAREGRIGACHKGQIYWRLALLSLSAGVLTEAIEFLATAVEEDRRRGDAFSAAIGLQSLLQPLVLRYKEHGWKFDPQIMGFYESSSPAERSAFAAALFSTHDLVAGGQLNVIKPEFFTFIQDESIRKVVLSSYDELLFVLGGPPRPTYYSAIFLAGSILEGMLDDLFTRDAQKLWRLFREDAAVMKDVDNSSRLRKKEFDPGMTLGQKILILRATATHARSPIPQAAILLMLILAEYRDLIHPRRRLECPFEANAYVARCVFVLLSHVAGHWWPKNIAAQLEDGST